MRKLLNYEESELIFLFRFRYHNGTTDKSAKSASAIQKEGRFQSKFPPRKT